MLHKSYGPYERYVKRPLDCVLACCAMLLLSPLLGAIAIVVKIKIGSPILFCQERPGKRDPKTGKEKIFKLYKFRSMVDKRDSSGKLLPDDERLTAFGRALRSTSLDELPELINIIRGDMAIIGPRPLLVEYLPYYTEEERHRHDVRPGLSGLAQINGRNTISWEDKFAYDIRYIKRITFLDDLKILLLTVVKTVRRADIRVGKEHVAGRLDAVRRKEVNVNESVNG